ncbi:MAG TPA: endonuclease III [Anaerolineae bacterium]|nr:endonuclease III [Anaerolineae bacterium]
MSDATPSVIAKVDRRLKQVFGSPRSRDRDAVSQLVATMLSQATTDTQTARSFEKLRQRFPTWEQVRDAPASQIAKQIQASGLSRQKAPRIKAALQHITRERGKIELDFLETIPLDEGYRWLMSIKGVGPKTASIVMLFTFRKPFFPVDTHIHRIAKRLGWVPQNASAEQTHQILQPLIPRQAHYRLHVNLIRHGREICIARLPRCEICPLTDLCDYYQKLHGPS